MVSTSILTKPNLCVEEEEEDIERVYKYHGTTLKDQWEYSKE